MKKFTSSIAAIIFALFILTSCGAEEKEKDTDKKSKKSAQDIKVEELAELNEKAEKSAQDTDKNTKNSAQDTDKNTKKSAQDTDKKTKKSAQDTDKNTKKSAQDIKEADLKEPCDFADAMLAVATEMNALKGEVKEGEEPTSEQGKRAKALMKKMEEIQDAVQNADLGFDDMQDCPSMNELNKL